jgi:hypothetical protein
MTECSRCGFKFSDSKTSKTEECPNCGNPVRSKGSIDPLQPVRKYFKSLVQIITHPVQHFRKMRVTGGIAEPLTFALITHWIGVTSHSIWKSILGGNFTDYMQKLMSWIDKTSEIDHAGRGREVLRLVEYRERFFQWAWGTGSIVADPFITLFTIIFTAALVFLGARILVSPGKKGAPDQITYESALRVVCFGFAPSILLALPWVGTPLATIGTAVFTIIGAKEVYRIGWGRAIIVALFPKVLLVSIILAGVTFLIVSLFSIASFFAF